MVEKIEREREYETGDERYRLDQEGVDVEPFSKIKGKRESHVYEDGRGNVIPATKRNKPFAIKGDTFRGGADHIHPNNDHRYHVLQDDTEYPDADYVKGQLKSGVKSYRDERRENRDR